MNILVTGASGTIGSRLTQRLLETHKQIYCQSRSERESRHGEHWMRFDLNDSESALTAGPKWDLVFHLAAQTSTTRAREDPALALKDNVQGFVRLLEVLRAQQNDAMVVITGTSTQVGLPQSSTITEDLPDHPITFYDATKLAAELFLKQYVREGWLRGCCLRLATVYGATGDQQSSDRGIIDRVVGEARAGRPVYVYGDGNYLRDYIHIDDVVEALVAAADHPDKVNGRAFVVGTGRPTTLKEAFEQAAAIGSKLGGAVVDIHHVQPPAGLSPIEFRNAVIDPRSFHEATGWIPRYDLASGLAHSYEQ